MEAVYHIFAFLKRRPVAKLVLDPVDIILNKEAFYHTSPHDWVDFYRDVQEELPPDSPKAKGKSVTMTCFLDSDHAGNVITRRSHTGIIIFVQNCPIIWYLKKQNTVESSSFVSQPAHRKVARASHIARSST